MSGQKPSAALTQSLSRRLAAPVDETARRRAARHVLDWAGCAVSGLNSEAGRAAARAFAHDGSGSCAGAAGTGRLDALSAALVNGSLGNVLEMDDVDKRAILHPGPTVIPAALAAAEEAGADANALLDAVVRGYEAVIRLGRAVGPGHYAFWHNTGTCGPLGAAAAAASVFGLDEDATAHALALAVTQASGFWQTRHEPASMAKQLHTARAAHAGLAAALLAREGFKGPLTVIEGEQGFFAATCPGGDPRAIMADPDADWRLFEVSFKPWPACRHAHAAIDAALELKPRAPDADEIEAIGIETYADAVKFCDRVRPGRVIEAKFSLQHAVASALLNGAPDLSHFQPDAFEAPAARALQAKAHVTAAERFDRVYPARYGAGVTITLKGGERLQAQAPDALGDPENPLTEDRLIAKARMLCEAGGFSPAQSDALIAGVLDLSAGGRLDAFTAALAARPADKREAAA